MLAVQILSFLFQNLKNSYQCSICFKTAHDEILRVIVDEKFIATMARYLGLRHFPDDPYSSD